MILVQKFKPTYVSEKVLILGWAKKDLWSLGAES